LRTDSWLNWRASKQLCAALKELMIDDADRAIEAMKEPFARSARKERDKK
jgi:hypothetical protein